MVGYLESGDGVVVRDGVGRLVGWYYTDSGGYQMSIVGWVAR